MRGAVDVLLRSAANPPPLRWSAQRDDRWDFEIVVGHANDCDRNGCVLASAFIPDAGRHELTIFPKMFDQAREEQVETLIHEIGHVFGLRHCAFNGAVLGVRAGV